MRCGVVPEGEAAAIQRSYAESLPVHAAARLGREASVVASREHAVEHERVDVHDQIQRSPKPLTSRNGAAVHLSKTALAGTGLQMLIHSRQIDSLHSCGWSVTRAAYNVPRGRRHP